MFVERDGVRLFVDVRGQGPALVYLHGLNGTHADASWVESRGFTVYAPDLRGRGQSSPVRDVEGHAFEEHVRDVVAILDAAGVAEALVLGASFGAAVAAAVALAVPSRVRALALVQSAFGGSENAMGEGDLAKYGPFGERIERDGLQRVAEEEAARKGEPVTLGRYGGHDEASLVAWLKATPRYRPFARASELGALTMPVLVIGGRDDVHTWEVSASYAAAIPGAILAENGAGALNEFLEQHR